MPDASYGHSCDRPKPITKNCCSQSITFKNQALGWLQREYVCRKRYQTLGMLTEPMSMFRFTTSLFLSNSGTRDHLSRIDNAILRSTFLAEMVWKLNEIKFEALNIDYPNLVKIFHFLQKSIMLFTQKSQHIFCRKIILNSMNYFL